MFDIQKLLIAVPFHFDENRLAFLKSVLAYHPSLAHQVELIIFTNVDDESKLQRVRDTVPCSTPQFSSSIISVVDLAHPFLLTWSHKQHFRVAFQDPSYTHFMYVEDDLEVTPTNIRYWLTAREMLRPFGVYPGFFRVEMHERYGELVSSDINRWIAMCEVKTIELGETRYVCLPAPYQGMFLYDRELMAEHLASHTSDPERLLPPPRSGEYWNARELANLGISYINRPEGFKSRVVVPYFPRLRQLDQHCFVYHLPENYAKSLEYFGKLRVRDLFMD